MLMAPLIVTTTVRRRGRAEEHRSTPSLETMRAAERINAENDAATVRFLVKWTFLTAIAVGVILTLLSHFFPIG